MELICGCSAIKPAAGAVVYGDAARRPLVRGRSSCKYRGSTMWVGAVASNAKL